MKSKKTQISRDRLTALKAERAKLRGQVESLGKALNRLTPKVTARLVYPDPHPEENPSAATDEVPVVVIEIEYGAQIYQATISQESFANRSPEVICQEVGIVAASKLMGPLAGIMVDLKAIDLLKKMQQIAKAHDPQLDLPVETKAGLHL